MAVDVNATRRQRAWDSIPDGASRTWTRQFRGSTYSLTLTSPQIRALHGGLVFSVDVLVTKDGLPLYEDRLNSPNPPMGVVDADGIVTDDPRQAFRQHVVDVVRAATENFTKPHLMRGPDGQFKGDTLAVRSSTADGRITSSNATWTTCLNGSSLLSGDSATAEFVRAQWNGSTYSLRQIFLDFDTSSLGSGATLSNGVFTLYGNGTAENDADNYDMQIRPYNWGGTLTTADWVDCNPQSNWTALTLMAHFDVGSWVQTGGTANNFTVDSYADVSKTGTTYVVVGLSALGSGTPTGSNDVEVRMADQAGTTSDPLLTVTYTISVSITSVAATATSQGEVPVPTIAPGSVVGVVTSNAETPTPVIAVDVVASTVTSQAETPAVSIVEDGANIDITSEVATVTSDATSPTPVIAPDSTAATATSSANAPTMDHSLNSVVATVSSDATAPTPTLAIDSTEATVSSSAETPAITLALESVVATVTADANAPGTSIAESSVTATATSSAGQPTPTISMLASAAESTAQANTPTTIHDLTSVAAMVSAVANTPTPQIEIFAETATATSEAQNPLIRIIAPAVDLLVSIAKTFLVRIGILKKHEVAVDLERTYNVALDFTASDGVALEVARTYEVEIIMSNETCYVGNNITATGRFTTVSSGALTDPTTVTATVQIPGGTKTTYTYGVDSEMAKSSTGIYTCTFTPSSAGKWIVKFTGAGAVVAVNQEDFTVLTPI